MVASAHFIGQEATGLGLGLGELLLRHDIIAPTHLVGQETAPSYAELLHAVWRGGLVEQGAR